MAGPGAGAGLPDRADLVERIVVVGFSHRTCPAALRERLYVDDAEAPSVLGEMARAGVAQALILSTCDRIEMQAIADQSVAEIASSFAAALAKSAGLSAGEAGGMTYRLSGQAALRHVFAVAASLDSRTIGEPQVLGQVRASHRLARDAGFVGPELETVLQAAYGTAKRVRSETNLAERPVSMAAVAAKLARDLHGDLARCGGALLGGEDMGELLAEQLMAAGLGRLTAVARTERRAAAQAARLNCHFAAMEQLAQTLVEADIIISAFGDGRHIVTGEMMDAVLRRRRRRPVFIIDASMPGDVEPAVARLDEAFVYDLNDLERLAMEGRQTRAAATGPAWQIVEAGIAALLRGQAERRTVPAVVALRARFEQLRREVLAAGDADAARATERLINRLLHDPSEVLKEIAAEGGADTADHGEALLRRLFRLEPSPDASAGEAGDAKSAESRRSDQTVNLNLDAKLDSVVARHSELATRLAAEAQPDAQEFVRLSKEYAELTPVAEKIGEIRKVQSDLAGLEDMIASGDPEMVKLAQDEQSDLKTRLPVLERELKVMLLPKDEADARNAILEVRAGAGGEEAALFASMLFDMYRRYSEFHKWKFEILSLSETGLGGYKDATASITGRNVFARLKFESGVHRIQRVPQTEASGRIHTSTSTVAVLPEAEEVDVHIEDKDLRIDVFRSSGPGGQSVNTTDSAVRITHLPTGVVVQQQDEKSQHKNKAKALKVLRARLYERQRMEQESARSAQRKSQVGTGERSERIRTYNFPDGRVTDHRIKLTLHKIDKIFAGDALDEMIDSLISEDEAARLADLQ